MKIAVIDGMGGGIGSQLTARLAEEIGAKAEIIALGANATATDRMLKAGASRGASGENAVRVTLREADIVTGPLGIIVPDAMMGEITPGIAQAVFLCRGEKFLVPTPQQHFTLIGWEPRPMAQLISAAVERIKARLAEMDGGS